MSIPLPFPVSSTRRVLRLALTLAAVAGSITCSSPTDAPEPPGDGEPPPPPPTSGFDGSLQLSGPNALIVHESVLLTVSAKDAQGHPVVASPVTFTTSDASVLQVSAGGVVTATGRGTATIAVQRDQVSARMTLSVRARVALAPAAGWEWVNYIRPLVGEPVQLAATYVDINGVFVDAAPAVDWQSSDPAVASVDETGRVVALQADQTAIISASTPDGVAETQIVAQLEGAPTSVRLAHVAPDLGPVTFDIHGLPPVTLQFGETANVTVRTQDIYVTTDGMPPAQVDKRTFFGNFEPGTTLGLYAIRQGNMSGLAPDWGTTDPIPADSGRVRLIQASNNPVAYIRPTGTPRSGLPELCYFDPGDPSPFYTVAAGTFDVLMQRKVGFKVDTTLAFARLPASVTAGHVVTLVLTGNTTSDASYIAFTDQ
ncbi:MAG TPA: hypothetical protein VFK36_09575 [Gemmatimonadales bacterium]|nr:hypothetical protein [Gemmatimonadales bacterium]